MNRRRQPQRTPPPVTSGSEALEADAVLQELDGDLALCLWKTVRTARLWAELPSDSREAAFNPPAYAERLELIDGLDLPSKLREALESIAQVLRGSSPRASEVADACLFVAGWAEGGGATGTALEFAQAAALLQPKQAGLALEVGRIAAERGEIARAESWYRQGTFTARQTRNWPAFANAFLGLGRLHFRRGDVVAARTAYLRALRTSRRHSQGLIAATACHHILEVAILSRRSSEIARYAMCALHGFRAEPTRLAELALTLSAYLIDRGYFTEGRRLLEAVPKDEEAPAGRLARAAGLAQAAAALGEQAAYHEALDEVAALLRESERVDAPTASWVGLLRASAWAADADAAALLEPHARHAAIASTDEETLEEISWLADPSAEPPDLRIRKAAAPLRALVDDLVEALALAGGPG